MNDKDFSEVRACFKEAGQIKAESKEPGRVSKTGQPGIKPVRTKMHPAHDHADCAKASSKKLTPLKEVN